MVPQILGLAHPEHPWAGSPHVFPLRLIPSILVLAAAPRAWLPQREQGFFHHALPCRVPLLRRARSSPGAFRNEGKPLLLEISAEKAAAAAVRGRTEVWGPVFGVSWELEALLPPVRTVEALMGFFGVSLLWLSAESFGKGQPGVCSLLCWNGVWATPPRGRELRGAAKPSRKYPWLQSQKVLSGRDCPVGFLG